MKHAATQALYSYWNGLRGERAAPERCDIDPAAIRGVLADTFLVEVDREAAGQRRLPIRLSGTRVSALFGEEIKGRDLLTLWRVEDRTSVSDLVTAALDDTCAIVAGMTAAPRGCSPLGLELLLLPLRHQGKTHARLLGSIVPADIPPWLGLLATEPLRLQTQRVVDPTLACEYRRGSTNDRGRHGVPDRPAPVRRDHLLIYEGGQARRRAAYVE